MLDCIVEEPNYEPINKLETQTICNALTIELILDLPHNKYSELVENPAIYLLQTGTPFLRPLYLGDSPAFPNRSTVA